MPQRLAQHLIAKGLLPAGVVDEALKRVERQGGTLDTTLLEMGKISEAGMLQAISDVSGVRLVNLADFEPNAEASPLVPWKMARQLNLVPLSLDGDSLHLAVTYPLSQPSLREMGFLLHRKLELWVALECRVRDWQAVVYGQKLEPRLEKLLQSIDHTRKRPSPFDGAVTESLSGEVLDRIALGIVEEPLLLDRPKKKKRRIEPLEPAVLERDELDGAVLEPQLAPPDELQLRTAMLEAPAAFRLLTGDEDSSLAHPFDEEHPTRVLDPTGYASFGREMTRLDRVITEPELPAVKVAFPGGVLPPRLGPPPPPPPQVRRVDEGTWVMPIAPPRPSQERVRPPPLQKPPPPLEVPAPPVRAADETDFSDVNADPVRTKPVAPATHTPAPRPARALASPSLPTWMSSAMPTEEPVQPSPPGLAPSDATEWTLAQARQSLNEASTSREALVSVILEYGRRTFDYVSTFAVLRGAAWGWDARGEGDVSAIGQLSVPLDAASVFRTVALTRGSYVGPLPPDALSQHYLALLGRAPRTVFLWPVEVKSRLVAMIYGDCGARPVSQRRLSDFILFCQDLTLAFHELIVFRKQSAQGAFAAPGSPLPEAPLPMDEPPPAADAEWLRGLITLLTGPDPSERSMAMLELMKTPAQSAAALAQAFPGPTGWSRLPVVELPEPDELGPIPGALARLGPDAGVALAPLLDAEDSDTRYLALLTAGSLKYPDVLDGVVRGLFDLEPDVSSAARAAASALKSLPQFAARLPMLREELASSDSLRKSLAARALGVLHDRESIDPLIELTSSADDLCAQSAAEALKELTRQPHATDTRRWTEWWADARPRRRVEWLVEALELEDFDLRLSAIDELTRGVGDNYGYFADGSPAERAAAVAGWRAALAARPELEL